MYVNIKNENYGYAVATYGDYVSVSNPDFARWIYESESIFHTGSVDYFRYNVNTDTHDYIGTIFKNSHDFNITIITEDANAGLTGPNYNIDTEDANSGITGPNYDLILDETNYKVARENSFGQSLDMYNKMLVIGCPYFTEAIIFPALSYSFSGSCVEVHNLGNTEYTAQSSSTYAYIINNPDINVTASFGKAVTINNCFILKSSI